MVAIKKVLIVCLLLFFCLAGCSGELSRAKKFRNQGRYSSALESYLFFAKANPHSRKVPYALLEAGKIYLLHLHEADKAVIILKRLVYNFPKSKYTLAGQQLIADIAKNHLADYRQAIVEYQRLIDIAPNSQDNDEYQLQIAHCYTLLNKHSQARIEYETVLKNYPESPLKSEALYGVANSYYIEGQYNKAINGYKQLFNDKNLKKDKRFQAKVIFGLASSYEEVDDYQQALALYRQLEKTYPAPQVIRLRIEKIVQRIQKRNRKDERKVARVKREG